MFYMLDQELARRRDLNPTDKLVYAIICDRVGKNPHTWAGVRKLAEDGGTSKTAVARSIARLIETGWLEIEGHKRGEKRYIRLAQQEAKCPDSRTLDNGKCPDTGTVDEAKCPDIRTLVSRF